ncbi:ESX secretion-associated protein EspG [Nocardia puris]|uniref:ESAT-6 protein secretion system EspG family protein n=1 Tax=Nocardia puris TaxID=208602 RepID=A0A366DBL5_9NOCA|nr:ESX secretion-associated protein EspG [Nocardia puris]MBF6214525.1 ESX secretion-associated protein EspG [Nocardia puris]MBF6365934.1 ESX secretion-associated protein EspG [Nocardia puris]MBF6460423.1 ESX secretion-associated protein EspG [Nocardia puris]RBO87423.1 ESAT-6 protein secretion system EspG family protein [Nocardia puris]
MTTVRRWRFTALEFRTLWESTGRDILPYPLRHWHTVRYESDALRLRRAAAESVRPHVDDDLVRALHVLFAPEARIEVAGFLGRNRERELRAHAGVHYQHGALARQHHAEDGYGDISLAFLPAEQVAGAVADSLPKCAAGRAEPMKIAADELDRPLPPIRDTWRTSPREEFEKFFNRPTTGSIHVGVYPWGSADNRHTVGRKDFQLTDFENDGRYVTFGTRTIVAKPTTRDRIAATLQEMITRTVEEVRAGDHLPR